MKLEHEIFLRIEPEPPRVTHQQQKTGVRNGKPYRYEDERLKRARALYNGMLITHAPDNPLAGPIYMESKWIFKKPKSGKGTYMICRPDCDNLQKLLQDCMTRCGFWKDDSQVMPCIQKVWTEDEPHGVMIKIYSLSDE